MRRAVPTVVLVLLTACASPTETSAPSGSGSSPTTPAASGTATLVTPQPSPTASRSPTPKQTKSPPPGSNTLGVDESDAGQTVRLKVGQKLEVRLSADYTQATSSDGGVLVRTSASGGYPTKQEMVAIFEARRAGEATVSSSTDYECLHATPSCALPQQFWSVGVIVS
jgi:hypothetical protein